MGMSIFYALPDIAGILLAAVAFAFLFFPEVLKSLEKYKKIRFIIFCLIIIVGIGAVISSQIQRNKDTVARKEDQQTIKDLNKSIDTLKSQIQTFVNAIKTFVTVEDIKQINSQMQTGMQSGFDRVVAAIKGKPVMPSAPIPTPAPVPTIENTRLIQRPTTSDRTEFPYALQVIIQSNVTLQSVALGLECDGIIGDFTWFIAGQMAYMSVMKGISGNVAELRFSYPPLTPESALVITVYSKSQIRVVKAYKLHP